ncbi:RNA recognition motif domain-containing protein [Ceratobasidium theobromae]|uniref:RNA recognition motif domain-containing protein n=1 Tax=Ceratobasidium theobromae TaxID=1582974 RepID=A0A5N5QJP2_9AGAM|nr:RNA recognition motif domain-containing protein [Ceratobasidium theobromae]
MAANPTTTEILTIPTQDPEPEASTSKATSQPPHPEDQRGTRLYVGNLDHSVDEYALLQVFSTFGRVTKLDFLYHTSGPLKGKPRGYAFVEYATKQEATKALVACHDKPLRRRRLTVTFASQNTHASYPAGGTGPHRRHTAPPKHTTLSLLKTQNKPQSTSAKIAALEAKLGSLERDRTSKEADALLSDVLGPNPTPSTNLASLPPKPPASIVPAANADGVQSVPRPRPVPLLGAGSKPGNPLLNLGVMPSSIKSAVSRPPALLTQEKDKPGKAALQASLGIVRKK